jgi:3-deoxy-manno-octulosonate cytidylyltransferase (CMP-KDO synthetase)
MKILGVIPSRLASTRFPNKPLVDIGGKTMIRRVYEQALKSRLLTDVVVATDHESILDEVIKNGGRAMLTSASHLSGTDRCNEVLAAQSKHYDFVVNIQGDEPFIHPEQIDELASMLNLQVEIATLGLKITDIETLFNPNAIKLVMDNKSNALYFSRSAIPYVRGVEQKDWLKSHTFYRHIGMYAYRADVLRKVASLPATSLELAESLEQLRWMQNGFKIKVGISIYETYGVDVPSDLEKLKLKGFY